MKNKCLFQCQKCNQYFKRTPDQVINRKEIFCINCKHKDISTRQTLSQFEIANRVNNIVINEYSGKYIINSAIGIKNIGKFICPKCDQIFERCVDNVWNKKMIFCNNCLHKSSYSNGVKTSKIALILHKLIEELTGLKWIHNYKIKGYGCFDIVNLDLKIIIEYDDCYHHIFCNGDKTQLDRQKRKKIINKFGWKILVIKSGNNCVPKNKQLKQIIHKLINNKYNLCAVTMKSWYNRIKYQQKIENYKIYKKKHNIVGKINAWTQAEEDWLYQYMIKFGVDKLDYKYLSKKIKKSTDAVKRKVFELKKKNNIPLHHQRKNWTEQELEYLKQNIDMDDKNLAQYLNRSISSIQHKKNRIKNANS